MTTRYRSFVAPRLPAGPDTYSPEDFNRFTNVLRLYFNQLDAWNGTVAQGTGGRFIGSPYGSWSDSNSQTAAANTVTLITLSNTDYSQDISLVSSSKITFKYPGVYNVQFSVQAANSSAQYDNITIWYGYNGTDVAASAGITAIPPKHGSINGALAFGWNQFFQINANDYLQLYWTTDSGASTLTTYAAGVSPNHPSAPAVAVTAQFVSAQPT
jgi:hypothetical protein